MAWGLLGFYFGNSRIVFLPAIWSLANRHASTSLLLEQEAGT
jgi:hypothetical protein